jgi:hypothetical protein
MSSPISCFRGGTWCSESEVHYLHELREYDLNDPLLAFPDGLPRDPITAKFAAWISACGDTPPGTAYEQSPNGLVLLDNGHRRASALALARRHTVQLWVCPMVWQGQQDNPNRLTDLSTLRAHMSCSQRGAGAWRLSGCSAGGTDAGQRGRRSPH